MFGFLLCRATVLTVLNRALAGFGEEYPEFSPTALFVRLTDAAADNQKLLMMCQDNQRLLLEQAKGAKASSKGDTSAGAAPPPPLLPPPPTKGAPPSANTRGRAGQGAKRKGDTSAETGVRDVCFVGYLGSHALNICCVLHILAIL